MAKITLSTIKKFIRENKDKLYINHQSSFDGMIDGTRYNDHPEWIKASVNMDEIEGPRLGVQGAWFVKSSRDYFKPVERDGFTGYSVSNCCANFYLGVKND